MQTITLTTLDTLVRSGELLSPCLNGKFRRIWNDTRRYRL